MSIRQITPEMRARILTSSDFAAAAGNQALAREYDACIIGSGPGGAVAAATLAQAGWKVILIERGPFFPAESSSFRVLDMSNRMGHLELTSGLRTALYQGKGLGGGSLIYGAVAMKPQDFIFDEWSRLSGVASINGESLEPHYKHIAEVMSVTKQAITQENKSNSIVRQMAAALGQSDGLETVSRYTQGCAGAGLCNLGCGFNLKGTMANSFIPLGLETGNLTILTECEAHGFEGTRSTTDSYRANGLKVTIKDFSGGVVVRRGTIKARHFILAAGAFFSSALLLNNRELPGRERIGRKIYLQPHAQIFALFDEPITKRGQIKDGQYIPYHGVPAIYNFTGFMRTHRFFWLASILFPANFASFISHLDASQHFELMQRFHQTMSITLTLKDDPEKSKIVMRDGQAQLDFKESRADIENLRQCFLLAARSMLATGARKVFLPLLKPLVIERESDLKKIESLKFGYDDLLLYSDHTSSGNQYGIDEKHGVTDPTGKVFGTENVFVSDSSLFPSASGINPSWTIMALSRHVALGLASKVETRTK